MGRTHHQRHAPRAAGTHACGGPAAASPSRRRAFLPIATPRAAVCRRSVEPRLGAHARDTRAASTRQAAALAQQLLARHGVLTREAVAHESVPGGFGSIYPVLKAMEDSGRLRRGYFVAGLGATQFALPGALDLLRSLRDPSSDEAASPVVVLSATDPASLYGTAVKFPASAATAASAGQARDGAGVAKAGRGPTRSVGATVILVDGALAGYLARGDRLLLVWLPEAEPDRGRVSRQLASALAGRARQSRRNAARGNRRHGRAAPSPRAHPDQRRVQGRRHGTSGATDRGPWTGDRGPGTGDQGLKD